MNLNLNKLLLACLLGIGAGSVMADDRHHARPFPRDVEAFHAILSPIWHSEPSKERLQVACDKASEMDRQARAIRSTDAARLVGSVASLIDQCKGEGGSVEAALVTVHDEFHHLIEHKRR